MPNIKTNINAHSREILSTEYWNLKMKQLNPQISWKKKGTNKSYKPTSKWCNLCLTEKLEILSDRNRNLFCEKWEIISQYCYKSKYRRKTIASTIISGEITWKDDFTSYRPCNVNWKSSSQAEDCKVTHMELWALAI